MARPLSEEKRDAILAAATALVATVGTGATTARIAQQAGISEGALFTYFPKKDALLNALYVALETELFEVMTAGFPQDGTPRQQAQHAWDSFVGWGAEDPLKRRAVRQLKASDRITAESKKCGEGLFETASATLDRSFATQAGPDMSPRLLHAAFEGLADVTMDLVVADPGRAAFYRERGFALFWQGIAA